MKVLGRIIQNFTMIDGTARLSHAPLPELTSAEKYRKLFNCKKQPITSSNVNIKPTTSAITPTYQMCIQPTKFRPNRSSEFTPPKCPSAVGLDVGDAWGNGAVVSVGGTNFIKPHHLSKSK